MQQAATDSARGEDIIITDKLWNIKTGQNRNVVTKHNHVLLSATISRRLIKTRRRNNVPFFVLYLPLSRKLRFTTLRVVWSPLAQRTSDRAG